MDRETPSLLFDTTVPKAIEYFRDHPGGFVLVNATMDRMQGVLTEAGLMRIYLRYHANPKKEELIHYREFFEPVQLIQEDEPFPEVVKKVLAAVGNRVFVINPQNKVVGFITAKKILPYFSQDEKMDRNERSQELNSSMQALRSDFYFFESFFSKSPFMMHSVDKEGVIQMANEMIHLVLGYEYGELIGKTIFDLYPQSAHKQAEAGLKTIFKMGYHQVVQGTMLSKLKQEIPVELVSRILSNQLDQPVGTMTISRPMDMKFLIDKMPEL